MIYAGFWRRVGATLIDTIIIMIPAVIINTFIPFIGYVVTFFYKPIFESSVLQATPGKAIMEISVVDENGDRLSFKKAFIRYLASFLSGLLLGFGYLMNLFTEKKQTLHDIIAETVVIKAGPVNVNYFTVWLEQIKKVFNFDAGETLNNSCAADSLERLHKLFQSGAITQAEYDEKKAELLKKI